MGESPAEDTIRTHAQKITDPLEVRIRLLESSISFLRGIGAILGAILGMGLASSVATVMSTRDLAMASSNRITAIEARQVHAEAAMSRRDDFDRQSREQLIEIRAELRGLRTELEDLSRRLQRQEDDRSPSPPPPRRR